VASISIPASVSAISLTNPSLPGPWIQPRDEDGIGGDRSPHGDVLATCLGFGEADGTDFGIGDGHARQRPVAGRLVCLAEDVAGCYARLMHRDVRERPAPVTPPTDHTPSPAGR
jgi:hypothetical protein